MPAVPGRHVAGGGRCTRVSGPGTRTKSFMIFQNGIDLGIAPLHNTGSEGITKLRNILALVLLGIAVQCAGLAAIGAPEIDPASSASAIALLAGAIVVIRGRRRS
jgi:hypothetical protein